MSLPGYFVRYTNKERNKSLFSRTTTTLVADPYSFLSQATINSQKVEHHEVIKKNNEFIYTPTGPYNPATKSYVDGRVSEMGGGNMSYEVYDTNNNAIVDNSERLGGMPKRYFATQSELSGKSGISLIYPEMYVEHNDNLAFRVTNRSMTHRYDGVRSSDSLGLRFIDPVPKIIVDTTDIPVIDDSGTYTTAKLGPNEALPIVRVQVLDPPTGEPVDDVNVMTAAEAVVFKDGETFQEKLDKGRLKGDSGTSDVPGPVGPRGEQGEQGKQGVKGDKGATGPIGNPGPIGPIGPRGYLGDTGPRGAQGVPGFITTTFKTVEDMLSDESVGVGCYVMISTGADKGNVYIRHTHGYSYQSNIIGPQGPVGPRGEQGERGDTGSVGPVGPRGLTGPSGQGYDATCVRGTVEVPETRTISVDFPSGYNFMNSVVTGCTVIESGIGVTRAYDNIRFDGSKILIILDETVSVASTIMYRLVLQNVGEGFE